MKGEVSCAPDAPYTEDVWAAAVPPALPPCMACASLIVNDNEEDGASSSLLGLVTCHFHVVSQRSILMSNLFSPSTVVYFHLYTFLVGVRGITERNT